MPMRGQGRVEYAVVLAFFAVIIIGAMLLLGSQVSAVLFALSGEL